MLGTEPMFYSWLQDTPVGPLLLAGSTDALKFLVFEHPKSRQRHQLPRPEWRQAESPFRDVKRQLSAYFAGTLKQFDVPLAADGTDFQHRVWQALTTVPYGETQTYGQIAEQIQQPTAARAVGLANGRNPISIIVPCHRIVGSNGQLTGYGGGNDRKRRLLELEGAL